MYQPNAIMLYHLKYTVYGGRIEFGVGVRHKRVEGSSCDMNAQISDLLRH
jgi:hypothetical protein